VKTNYSYDAQGNRLTATAPNGRVTRFGYDSAGRLTERTENHTNNPPAADENLTTYYAYDTAGRKLAVRAPTVNRDTFTVTGYGYDAAGRVSAEVRNCTVLGTTAPQADQQGEIGHERLSVGGLRAIRR
jgi:YD repeat-containing protein